MSELLEFQRKFASRHEFDDSEAEILRERWPDVKFSGEIPLAWIFPLDELLCDMKRDNPIKEIRQDFGQLIIVHNATGWRKNLIDKVEEKLRNFDIDLMGIK